MVWLLTVNVPCAASVWTVPVTSTEDLPGPPYRAWRICIANPFFEYPVACIRASGPAAGEGSPDHTRVHTLLKLFFAYSPRRSIHRPPTACARTYSRSSGRPTPPAQPLRVCTQTALARSRERRRDPDDHRHRAAGQRQKLAHA